VAERKHSMSLAEVALNVQMRTHREKSLEAFEPMGDGLLDPS
jgi:hypothetical protein